MSDTSKAVFLSYASQDAEAAKRIADALRAAGVEVWFDAEGGLEHGDEWDAKIRRQIKECVLFIAVISANTQAREEGYFRIEWELAAQRALGIASGVAFILPVVIDGTRQPGALVPDRFRSVQWTKLPGGNVPPDVLQRFLKLWSHRAGMLKPAAAEVVADGSGGSETPRGAGRSRPIWPWLVLGVLAVGVAYLIFKPRRSPEEIAKIVADTQKLAQAVTPPAAPLPGDWPKDPELRRAMDLLNGSEANSEDFTLAEEIANRALTQRPTDPEAVIVMARTQGAFLQRGFDRSDERIALARRYAERAVQLAPNDAEALAALGSFVARSDQARAIELLNKAIALRPAEPFIYRQRDNAMFNNPQVPAADAIASTEKTAALFPGDALAHYELARHYRDVGRIAEMEQELDRTIAITPIANAIVWKSRIALWGRGDPAEMKALLERVPGRVRSLERVVFSRWAYAMATGQREEGRIALEDLTSNWIEDFDYIGPKALLAAQLLEQQGKPELARLKYEAALAELRARQARTPGNATLRSLEVWIAHGLGRDEDARTLNRTRLESIRRPYQFAQLSDWWFSAIPSCLLIGDRPTALALIREAVTPAKAVAWDRTEAQRLGEGAPDTTAAGGRAALRMRFKFDPRMAPFRGDPEIQALLAEPGEKSAAATPNIDDKSVAVLAFANLSDDKANEYFSDGISEELLNVLAKVPKLKVAARTSSFYFKGRNEPIPEIAQKLGVAYVVEGSVRKAGDKVRITAQLIKAADGFHVWSETYDRDLKDIFAVQDEIAKNILGVVKGSLLGEAELPHATTTKIEAYTFFLQAQGAFAKRGEANLRESIRLFEAALAIDPDYVPALVGLAQARVVLPNYAYLSGVKAREITDGALQAARRALALDPQNAAAHAVIGWELFQFEWRWSEGLAEVLRARDLAPNDPWNWNCLGDYYRYVGDYPQALSAKQREWELDPLSPNSHWDLSYSNLVGGNYDQAIHWSEICVGLAPHNVDSYMPAILAAGRAGRLDLMRRTLAAARQNIHEGEGMLLLLGAYCAILEKKPDEAHRLLAQAVPLAEGASASPSYLGYCYLLLGEADQARIWLQRGYDRYDEAMVWNEIIDFDVIAANPKTRPILDQPKLKELYELRQRNARAGLNKL